MKRTVIASILIAAASTAAVTTSYAQGQILFQNYASSTVNALVTYANTVPSLGGELVGSEFSANILYSFGAGILGVTYTDLGLGQNVPFYGTDGNAGSFAGLFSDPTQPELIPGYTTGAIDFIVQAYNGATYATSTIRGQSSVVSLTGLATAVNGNPVGDLFSDNSAVTAPLTAFSVVSAPEPSSLALAGLGGFGMLMAFRRKKA